jgi:hypothetical protein
MNRGAVLVFPAVLALLAGGRQTRMRSIGKAHMELDGTVVLDLATQDGGVNGRALFRHPRRQPDCGFIGCRDGGTSVGQVKAVLPF